MASCGPPPPRAAATPAAAAVTNSSSTCCSKQYPVLLQYTLQQHPLSSKDNASTSSDILAAASHARAAAVLIPGLTSTHIKVNAAATFGHQMSPVSVYFTKLLSVRGTNQGKNVMLPALPRRQGGSSVHPQGVSSVHPQRYHIRNLHKASYYIIHPGRRTEKCIQQMFLADS